MRFLVSAVIITTLFVSRIAGAQDAPRVLSFQEMLELVRAKNPALNVARANVAIADGEVDKAWTGWQPNLNAAGNVTFNGGATTVQGDILAAGTGTSKINSTVGRAGGPRSSVRVNGALDLLWSGAPFRADATARGEVTVNDRVIEGRVTLPPAHSPSINGGRIDGGVAKSDSISPVSSPQI